MKVKENILAFDILLMISNDNKKSSYNITDKNKIYILPDYKCNHVKTIVPGLKDGDFAKGADEYKNNIPKNKGNYDDNIRKMGTNIMRI